jgi:hypothetical protein
MLNRFSASSLGQSAGSIRSFNVPSGHNAQCLIHPAIFAGWEGRRGVRDPVPQYWDEIGKKQPQILRLTTPKLKNAWGPIRSG